MFIIRCLVLFTLLQAGDIALGVSSTGWPYGNYGLLKPVTGCPTGWNGDGWLYQDTEDTDPSNNRSQILHVDGHVALSYVTRWFCVKMDLNSYGERQCPEGKYCIYKSEDLGLKGIKSGSIQMKDEYDNNDWAVDLHIYHEIKQTKVKQVQRSLRLHFNCQTDGDPKVSINLPTSTPFYLLPYGSSECQQVKWMTATTEWIKYHTNDYNNYFRKWGKIPHYELGHNKANSGITMYYCYYQSCNNTLFTKQGVFQSPGFPGEYPDGQLCSWEIPVPLNHTIQVHFTNFLLNGDGDVLEIHKKWEGKFKKVQTFEGVQEALTMTFVSDVLFVFRSNEANNSYGFRAEYSIFIPCDRKTKRPAPLPTPNKETFTTPTSKSSQITAYKTTTYETTAYGTTGHETTGYKSSTKIPTKEKSCNCSASISKESRVSGRDRPNNVVAIVIPLVCLIVVAAIVIDIVYRCRSTICPKCKSKYDGEIAAMNPTYGRGTISLHRPTTATTEHTPTDTMYQPLSHDTPQYAPDYESLDENTRANMDNGCHLELGPIKHTDVLCQDPNTTEVQISQIPDEQQNKIDQEVKDTRNPLYESASNTEPLVTPNKLYENIE